MRKEQRIALYKMIWCKIRYWQSLRDISDAELAATLQVGERTLLPSENYRVQVIVESFSFPNTENIFKYRKIKA